MEDNQSVNEWFELTYAQYLTIPRSVLEAMPLTWQHKFTKLLRELDERIDWMPKDGHLYVVELHKEVDSDKPFRMGGETIPVNDPLQDYRHVHPEAIPFKEDGQRIRI